MALTLCLDLERNHMVVQKPLSQADCHPPNHLESDNNIFAEYVTALAGQENDDCIDISLSGLYELNRHSKKLSILSKAFISFTYAEIGLEYQRNIKKQISSVLKHPPFPSSSSKSWFSVILLI